MTDLPSPPTRATHFLRERILTFVGGGDLAVQVAELRSLVEATTAQAQSNRLQIEAVNEELRLLRREVAALTSEVREDTPALLEQIESARNLEQVVSTMATTLRRMSEQEHLHHLDIGELKEQLERLAGAIQDESALDRRLLRIENRQLGLASDV